MEQRHNSSSELLGWTMEMGKGGLMHEALEMDSQGNSDGLYPRDDRWLCVHEAHPKENVFKILWKCLQRKIKLGWH